MAQHTPGPWRVYNKPLRSYLKGSRIIEIQSLDGRAIVHWQGFDSAPGTAKQKLANARLIAAAPKMYAALMAVATDQGLSEVIAGIGEGDPPFMLKVAAAIATATKSNA